MCAYVRVATMKNISLPFFFLSLFLYFFLWSQEASSNFDLLQINYTGVCFEAAQSSVLCGKCSGLKQSEALMEFFF